MPVIHSMLPQKNCFVSITMVHSRPKIFQKLWKEEYETTVRNGGEGIQIGMIPLVNIINSLHQDMQTRRHMTECWNRDIQQLCMTPWH